MTDQSRAEMRAEAAEVFRWLLLFPTFAVLVILSANFTLGFFKWIGQLEGWLFYAMLPVAAVVVLSNALASFIACMVAPRKRSASILLGVGHLVVMIYGYVNFEWTTMTTIVLSAHAVMVYLGLAAVYYLDRLHTHELEVEAGSDSTTQAEPEPAP